MADELRKVAIEALADAEANRRFIDESVASRASMLEGRDRRLFHDVCFGATRHRSTIDHLLAAYVRAGVDRQRPELRHALRIGVYQLVYLSRVPAHAAVHRTVEAVKSLGAGRRDAGFVNAVLQKIAKDIHRKSESPPLERDDPAVLPIRDGYCHLRRPVLPSARTDLVEHLALKTSHPSWIVARWLERYGEEEARLLFDADNRAPAVTARITKRAPRIEELIASLAEDGIEARPEPEDMVTIASGDPGSARSLAEGWIQVQDATAMRIGAALAPPPNSRVLDLCAAPGGKAGQLLEAVGAGGHVVAADRSEAKLALLRESLARIGANFSARLVPDDPASIDLGEVFGAVLLDAPCSNTGVLARRPDARWRLRPGDLASLAVLQSALLDAAYRHLAPGGKLVYGTCSIEPAENEERVAEFIALHPDMTEIDSRLFLPHRSGADGGYYSTMRRGR